MTYNIDQIRYSLAEIRRVCNHEMTNVPLSQCWPMISRLIEANAFTSDEMRGLALEHFVDDLVKTLGAARQTINACNDRIEREEREAAARRAAAAARPRALIA